MQFKVKDIGKDGVDVALVVTPAWLAAECPDLGATLAPAGLRFNGRLEESGHDYLLRGKLKGALATTCHRCLEPAQLAIDTDISVIYVEKEDSRAAAQDDDTLEAPDVLTFADGVIDLGTELRDEILLAMPVSVPCREDCAGLCAVCGGNRNVSRCDCEEKRRLQTSKFAALAKLKS